MKRLRLFAGLAAFCLALISLSISAQATLGAPTDLSITGSTAHLTISWSAPLENGGSTITAYDLRYIRNDATNKSEDQWSLEASAWSSGSLTYTLTGLARDIAYDVQLRAVNANDDGPWSAIATASTTDHSDTTSGATTLALGSSIEGSINPADDADYFRIVVPSQDDLWVYASGGLELLASSSMPGASCSSGTRMAYTLTSLAHSPSASWSIQEPTTSRWRVVKGSLPGPTRFTLIPPPRLAT